MLINKSEYNPLGTIFGVLPINEKEYTTEVLDTVQAELFKAGIVPETSEEFKDTLSLLRAFLVKEYYGKK
jgi:hypothetical protein